MMHPESFSRPDHYGQYDYGGGSNACQDGSEVAAQMRGGCHSWPPHSAVTPPVPPGPPWDGFPGGPPAMRRLSSAAVLETSKDLRGVRSSRAELLALPGA